MKPDPKFNGRYVQGAGKYSQGFSLRILLRAVLHCSALLS